MVINKGKCPQRILSKVKSEESRPACSINKAAMYISIYITMCHLQISDAEIVQLGYQSYECNFNHCTEYQARFLGFLRICNVPIVTTKNEYGAQIQAIRTLTQWN